jgi:hypothetical protein
MSKNISPLTFIDKLVKKNELGQPFTLMDHQLEILRLAFALNQENESLGHRLFPGSPGLVGENSGVVVVTMFVILLRTIKSDTA